MDEAIKLARELVEQCDGAGKLPSGERAKAYSAAFAPFRRRLALLSLARSLIATHERLQAAEKVVEAARSDTGMHRIWTNDEWQPCNCDTCTALRAYDQTKG